MCNVVTPLLKCIKNILDTNLDVSKIKSELDNLTGLYNAKMFFFRDVPLLHALKFNDTSKSVNAYFKTTEDNLITLEVK